MSKFAIVFAAVGLALSLPAAAQVASVTIESKNVTVKYTGPSMKGRKIFGGVAPYNQVWKIGEGAPAAFHTDADLVFKGVAVPKGDYTLYVLVGQNTWQLIVNKAAGAKAATYDPKLDVGRVPMTLAKPPAPLETCKITLTKTAALAARMDVAWENTVASVPFHLDRVSEHSEW